MLIIAIGCLGSAYLLFKSDEARKIAEKTEHQKPTPQPTEVTIDKLLSNDILEMELGVGLIRLADSRQGGNLLGSITQVRKELANEMGIILPKIRIRDNMQLGNNQFRIRIQGNVAEQGEIQPDCCLAIDFGSAIGPLGDGVVRGIADERLTGSPAFWVQPNAQESAQDDGYAVKTATEVLAGLLKSTARENASHLLTRDATKQLIDEVAKTSPAVVEELIPGLMSLAHVQRILKTLVSEGISIRPLNLILETLGDNTSSTSNRWDLTEQIRIRLSRHISSGLAGDSGGSIPVFTIAQDLEDRIACAWERDNDEIRLGLPQSIVESLAHAIQDAARQMVASGMRPIALVDQSIRPVIAELAFDNAEEMFVLGSREASGASIDVVGEITAEQINSVANAA